MNSIPRDIYETVHRLSVAIVNASGAADDGLCASLVQTLRSYYEEQTALGRSHPFLTEALADHTEDPREAVALYELALSQAVAFSDEPMHTKRISVAERLIELGNTEQALMHLREARVEATRRGDTFREDEAYRLEQELGA